MSQSRFGFQQHFMSNSVEFPSQISILCSRSVSIFLFTFFFFLMSCYCEIVIKMSELRDDEGLNFKGNQIRCLLSLLELLTVSYLPKRRMSLRRLRIRKNPKAASMYLATLLYMYAKTVSKMQKILLYSF